MIAIHELPETYIDKLMKMVPEEIAVAAATYRSSCRRKGTATQLILNWYRQNHTREEHEKFLLFYAQACAVVKIQRRISLAERPKDRPVVGKRHHAYASGRHHEPVLAWR